MPISKATVLSILGALAFGTGSMMGADELPRTVAGLSLVGTRTRAVAVAVRNREGALLAEAEPAIAVLRTSPLSPNDPVRDGAREFEVLLTVGSLLRHHALSGVVGIGNRRGLLMPDTEQALNRSALMGIPVVKVAQLGGYADAFADNFLIEAGAHTEESAKELLAECILRFGALPPAANPANPTEAELTAIRTKLTQYQNAFNVARTPVLVALR